MDIYGSRQEAWSGGEEAGRDFLDARRVVSQCEEAC
jgi:hypothetical protein